MEEYPESLTQTKSSPNVKLDYATEKQGIHFSNDFLLRLPTDEKRQHLVESLAEFWDPRGDGEKNKFQDVEIFCGKGGDVIQAHGLILSAISVVFRNALR